LVHWSSQACITVVEVGLLFMVIGMWSAMRQWKFMHPP
jgi:hypothetical protein